MEPEEQQQEWGLIEIGAFKNGGEDSLGLTIPIEVHDAAILVLVRLADPDWLSRELFQLFSRARQRVEFIGPQNIPNDGQELPQWTGCAGPQAMPGTRTH